MSSVTITIPGTPNKSVRYYTAARLAARTAMREAAPFEGPLYMRMTVHVFKPTRPRWPWPANQPRLEGVQATLTRAMTGVVFRDANRLVAIDAIKVYGRGKPCVEIMVEAKGL